MNEYRINIRKPKISGLSSNDPSHAAIGVDTAESGPSEAWDFHNYQASVFGGPNKQ